MANTIRTGNPRGFNKGHSSKFREGSRVRQTSEEGWRTYWPKHCGNNNKDEDSSLKNLYDKNQQASSQKFRQLIMNKIKKEKFISLPFIVRPYSLLALWSSSLSKSSLLLFSKIFCFSFLSTFGNAKNGSDMRMRTTPQMMKPPHQAPIHRGSPGIRETSYENRST